MKTKTAVDLIQKADIDIFMNECAAVECLPAALNNPREPVWFLRSWNEATPMHIDEIQLDAVTPKVSAKTLELALNIHEEMTRYQFRTPSKRNRKGGQLGDLEWQEKCRAYLNLWIELIVAEKKRQMQLPKALWPFNEGYTFPWEVNSWWDMPIVLHLSKESQKKKRRTSWQ